MCWKVTWVMQASMLESRTPLRDRPSPCSQRMLSNPAFSSRGRVSISPETSMPTTSRARVASTRVSRPMPQPMSRGRRPWGGPPRPPPSGSGRLLAHPPSQKRAGSRRSCATGSRGGAACSRTPTRGKGGSGDPPVAGGPLARRGVPDRPEPEQRAGPGPVPREARRAHDPSGLRADLRRRRVDGPLRGGARALARVGPLRALHAAAQAGHGHRRHAQPRARARGGRDRGAPRRRRHAREPGLARAHARAPCLGRARRDRHGPHGVRGRARALVRAQPRGARGRARPGHPDRRARGRAHARPQRGAAAGPRHPRGRRAGRGGLRGRLHHALLARAGGRDRRLRHGLLARVGRGLRLRPRCPPPRPQGLLPARRPRGAPRQPAQPAPRGLAARARPLRAAPPHWPPGARRAARPCGGRRPARPPRPAPRRPAPAPLRLLGEQVGMGPAQPRHGPPARPLGRHGGRLGLRPRAPQDGRGDPGRVFLRGRAGTRCRRMRGARAALLGMVAAAAMGAIAAPAHATTLPGAFSAPCPVYGDTQICSGEVPSFDGSKLDVDVTLPRHDTGTRHPLIVMLHGFGNNKHEWESLDDEGDGADKDRWNNHWFARHGYYVLTYTARGFRDDGPASGSSQPPPPAEPSGSVDLPNGTIHIKSRDYEIRDTQWLAALVAATFPDVDPNRVAVTGGSYGGGESWTQASQAHWDFPHEQDSSLPVLDLQVAIPKYPWTDLAYALAPNGHGGGP